MGGSASYRLAKKIANAKQNGAPQSEIDELESKRQEALEAERQKRREAKQPKEVSFLDRVNSAKDKNEFATVMRERYGDKVSEGFINMTELSMAKRVMSTIDELEKRYPFMTGFVKEFDVRGDAVAAMSQGGRLSLNPAYWGTKDNESLYDSSYNTPNSTPESSIAHEFGHAIHTYLYNLMSEGASDSFIEMFKLMQKRQDGTFLADVYKLAKKKGKFRSKDALFSGISEYAQVNSKEAFAEAFADVYSNGDNASKASKAYVEAMFEVLEGYGVKIN